MCEDVGACWGECGGEESRHGGVMERNIKQDRARKEGDCRSKLPHAVPESSSHANALPIFPRLSSTISITLSIHFKCIVNKNQTRTAMNSMQNVQGDGYLPDRLTTTSRNSGKDRSGMSLGTTRPAPQHTGVFHSQLIYIVTTGAHHRPPALPSMKHQRRVYHRGPASAFRVDQAAFFSLRANCSRIDSSLSLTRP
jgi:hypothetical protein